MKKIITPAWIAELIFSGSLLVLTLIYHEQILNYIYNHLTP